MAEITPDTIIRTLGLYQPFASLMLHGKVETRFIRVGKTPPFKKGKYIIYSTKKRYFDGEIFNISGAYQSNRIEQALRHEPTRRDLQKAICIGDLIEVRPMTEKDEDAAFVEYKGIVKQVKKGEAFLVKQWCLIFENVQRITPFDFKDASGKSLGKQGVGIFPVELYNKIKIAN